MSNPFYFSNLAVLAVARAVDLGSTYLYTPDLKREGNPIIRSLGWKWTIVANAVALVLIPLNDWACALVVLASLLAGVLNLGRML